MSTAYNIKLELWEHCTVPIAFLFCTGKQADEIHKQVFGESYDAEDSRGMTVYKDGRIVVSFHDDTPNLIAHECSHVIGYIFEHIGEQPVFDERVAYLLEDLILKVESLRNKKSISVSVAVQKIKNV